MPKLLKEQKVDGVIVLGKMTRLFLDMLKKNTSIPIVYMDFTDEGQDVDAQQHSSQRHTSRACRMHWMDSTTKI